MTANGRPVSAQPATGLRNRRAVLIGLAIFTAVALIAGGVVGWTQRHDRICRDGKPPVQQLDQGLGQVEYRCHDGQIVKK